MNAQTPRSLEENQAPPISETYAPLNAADETHGFEALFAGNWLAWPIIKVPMLWALMVRTGSDSPQADSGFALFKQDCWSRLSAIARDIRTAARRVPLARERDHILLVGVHKPISDLEGRRHDFFFGDLACGRLFDCSVEFVSYPLANDPAEASAHSLAPLLARARLLTLALLPFQIKLARALRKAWAAGPLRSTMAPVAQIAALLANFHARRILFGRFLAARRPRLIVFTYAPGRMAEVAAGREAGIPVLELQHGVFGPADPDYNWSPRLKSVRSRMPLPDRIAVFGEAFREVLLAGGFWQSDEVRVCGCAAFDLIRAEPAKSQPSVPRCVTIFSQSLFREEIRRVLLEYAALQRRDEVRFSLVLHPGENNGEEFYGSIVTALPGLRIVSPGQNSLRLIVASDIVVACNSLALLEACSLGRRAISVTRRDGTAGLRDLIWMKDLDRMIEHIATGDELAHALEKHETAAASISPGARAFGESLYALGWSSAIRSLIGEVLGRGGATSSSSSKAAAGRSARA